MIRSNADEDALIFIAITIVWTPLMVLATFLQWLLMPVEGMTRLRMTRHVIVAVRMYVVPAATKRSVRQHRQQQK